MPRQGDSSIVFPSDLRFAPVTLEPSTLARVSFNKNL